MLDRISYMGALVVLAKDPLCIMDTLDKHLLRGTVFEDRIFMSMVDF